jgi:hypothetical protein
MLGIADMVAECINKWLGRQLMSSIGETEHKNSQDIFTIQDLRDNLNKDIDFGHLHINMSE